MLLKVVREAFCLIIDNLNMYSIIYLYSITNNGIILKCYN